MIDRGALIVARVEGAYRGVHRPSLDAVCPAGKAGAGLKRRYVDAVVAGDGVLEDLDEAAELLDAARAIRLGDVDLVVFEVPQEPAAAGALPVASPPPAEGLALLGWDVFEPLEPWWSAISKGREGCALNAHGLFDRRADAERLAAALNTDDAEDHVVVGRVWLHHGGTE